ncbi:hypothetical protein [Actinoplanes derwentensis]|uniref:hypothetical protein n=1 Tax=Actinoplanes derwentensis TaxID=113562 RepID=UPI0012FE62CC|nr:hypothetical protein [Actinoplanes derwentensis]
MSFEVVVAAAPPPPDRLPLPLLLTRYPTPEALRAVTNGQLTSTRSGIPKAEAVLRYARILVGRATSWSGPRGNSRSGSACR